jgi:hypothetical protein
MTFVVFKERVMIELEHIECIKVSNGNKKNKRYAKNQEGQNWF